ncbi:hypothetical protein D3C87_1537110 [compost metagenome]
MAAIGRIRSPTAALLLMPPHLPRNKTALGAMADKRSIIVAAVGLPIPKLIMVIPSAVAQVMGFSLPTTGTWCISANIST